MIWLYLLIPVGVILTAIVVMYYFWSKKKFEKIRKRHLLINGKDEFLDLEEAVEKVTEPPEEETGLDAQINLIDEVLTKFEIPRLSHFYYELIWARGIFYWLRSERSDGKVKDLLKAKEDMTSILDHPIGVLKPHSQVKLQGSLEHVVFDLSKKREVKNDVSL